VVTSFSNMDCVHRLERLFLNKQKLWTAWIARSEYCSKSIIIFYESIITLLENNYNFLAFAAPS